MRAKTQVSGADFKSNIPSEHERLLESMWSVPKSFYYMAVSVEVFITPLLVY